MAMSLPAGSFASGTLADGILATFDQWTGEQEWHLAARLEQGSLAGIGSAPKFRL
jgi:hypothetical protein